MAISSTAMPLTINLADWGANAQVLGYSPGLMINANVVGTVDPANPAALQHIGFRGFFDTITASDSATVPNLITPVSINHAPTIPTVPINLPVGTANTPYQISKTQLLAGFNDMDGDTLSVTNLTATNGMLNPNFTSTTGTLPDSWTFTPNPNYSGVVSLNYSVTDGKTNGLVAAPAVNFNVNKAFNNPPTGDIKIDGFAKAGVTLTVNRYDDGWPPMVCR
jgi:hypothetical protein